MIVPLFPYDTDRVQTRTKNIRRVAVVMEDSPISFYRSNDYLIRRINVYECLISRVTI